MCCWKLHRHLLTPHLISELRTYSEYHAMQLDCVAQNYAWGKKGLESSVARFKLATCGASDILSSQSYAELWYYTIVVC
jgi:hypothetical protein